MASTWELGVLGQQYHPNLLRDFHQNTDPKFQSPYDLQLYGGSRFGLVVELHFIGEKYNFQRCDLVNPTSECAGRMALFRYRGESGS